MIFLSKIGMRGNVYICEEDGRGSKRTREDARGLERTGEDERGRKRTQEDARGYKRIQEDRRMKEDRRYGQEKEE